ncbi:unnamed protein product [Chironomus riparius]|uniref:Uncharacterized protein n=1 Tax=Chironomus riparius TaxID=315576 RepID=A0A9N9WKS2_9DIPT|nr:unnamed protein product [Chironomus riparius]
MISQIKLKKFQIVLILVFLLHTYWIAAQDVNLIDDPDNSNKTHWFNCTINNTIYYDNDCFSWLGNFILGLGLILTVLLMLCCCCFWYCLCSLCKIICCSDNPREVIYTTYVYPSSYTQIP